MHTQTNTPIHTREVRTIIIKLWHPVANVSGIYSHTPANSWPLDTKRLRRFAPNSATHYYPYIIMSFKCKLSGDYFRIITFVWHISSWLFPQHFPRDFVRVLVYPSLCYSWVQPVKHYKCSCGGAATTRELISTVVLVQVGFKCYCCYHCCTTDHFEKNSSTI